MSFYDRLSSIVDAIPARGHLFLCGDFNATSPVDKVRVNYRCGEANRNTKMLQSFLSAMTGLLPMHEQGINTARFRLLLDQIGVRHGLIAFSALFVIGVTSENPMHLTHI